MPLDDRPSAVRYPRDVVSDRFADAACPAFELGRARPLIEREGRSDLELVSDVLTRLDLTALASHRLDTLSGGELQRAHLARAVAQDTPGRIVVTGVGHANAPPDLAKMERTLEAVRLRLSVSASTMTATPPGP